MVWDAIKAKESEAEETKIDVSTDWYMQKLIELHDIHYEYKKRRLSYIDWDNYTP